MNDKKIKEAMKQYIETQADNISSESEEKHDLTSLDEKVYATLGTNQNKHKTAAVWSFRKISALAAICLGCNNDHIFVDFIWSMQRLFCTKKYQTECTMSFFGICGRRDDRSSNLVTSDTGN